MTLPPSNPSVEQAVSLGAALFNPRNDLSALLARLWNGTAEEREQALALAEADQRRGEHDKEF